MIIFINKKIGNNGEQYGYGPNSGYGVPQTGYGVPQTGYGVPQTGYGVPSYSGTLDSYGAPTSSYSSQNNGYGTSNGYYASTDYAVPGLVSVLHYKSTGRAWEGTLDYKGLSRVLLLEHKYPLRFFKF